jgi:peptidoglycan/xylan/chitin deacetylase (PgdA/CDA1 family)
MLQSLPPDPHSQTTGAGPALSWAEYLDRIRCVARHIVNGRPVQDDFLAFPRALPEYRPDYLGEVLSAEMRDELGRRSIDANEWKRWRPDLQALIAQVLDWPQGNRVRAIALAAAKHGLGVDFHHCGDASDDVLAEVMVDIRAPRDHAFSVSRPTAVQLSDGGRHLGLVFLTGYEDAARLSFAQAGMDQAGDLQLRALLRCCVGHGRFWIATVSNAASRLRRRSLGELARHRESEARAVLSAGARACLEQQLRRPSAAGSTHDERRLAFPSIPILMYHRVADDGDPRLARYRVTPGQFEQQMGWLKQNGFTPLSLDSLTSARRGDSQMPRRPVLITFDDGYRDFYDHAWPVLRKLDFPSVMFVVAGKVGDRSDWDQALGRPEPLMSWSQLAEISAGGVTIGSHSLMHRRFSRLDVHESYDDMRVSAEIIARELGQRPTAFCYPYGVYDRLVERLLPACTYEFGFTCDPPAATQDNPLRLPRIEIMGSDDISSFSAKVESCAFG